MGYEDAIVFGDFKASKEYSEGLEDDKPSSRRFEECYREVTGTESSFDEYFYDGLEENHRYYSVSNNEELAEALSEIFGPDVLELA